MKERYPYLRNVYFGCEGFWPAGCFVSTVVINEEAVRRHIENQAKEDLRQAKLDI